MRTLMAMAFCCGFFAHSSSFAAGTGFDWLEGNWLGCEDGYMQEKAISSGLGGEVVAANKILQNDAIVQSGFIRVKPGSTLTEGPTIEFYSGTAVDNIAKCRMADDHQIVGCDAKGFSVTITFTKGSSRKSDQLRFVHTVGGVKHTLDMQRAERGVPACH
jgi:hypothetical protein